MDRREMLAGMLAAAVPADRGAGAAFSFTEAEDRLVLRLGEGVLATYVYRDEKILRPHFVHLRTPDGLQVTRSHPPVAGRDAVDHETMHPGLWLAFGDLSGHDFWRNRARVVHEKFADAPRVTARGAGFTALHRYEAADGRLIGRETARFSFRKEARGWLLLWDSTFQPVEPLVFGDQEEMGLGVRVATPLSVREGGTIVNSAGQKNEKEVWGQPAEWCAYGGMLAERQAGVVLMSHPGNFRRPWFHARDYGLLVANPFGRNAFTRGERSALRVAPDEKLRLRFGVLVYSVPAGEPVDFARAYAAYTTAGR